MRKRRDVLTRPGVGGEERRNLVGTDVVGHSEFMTGLIVLCKDRLEQLFPWISRLMGQDILAVFAIAFTFVQFLDTRDEEKRMKKIQGRIRRLLNDATARSVGTFPTNLKSILAAKSSIRIIVDFPGYGIYSDPVLYGRYLKGNEGV
jgi:hypothetical protein